MPLKKFVSDLQVLGAIEQAAFHGDLFALTALSFVEQQDRYGYSGAWEKRVERYTWSLQWYKAAKARERAAALAAREHFASLAHKRCAI